MQKEGNLFEHHSQIVTAISTNPPKFHQWVAQVKLTSALLINHLFHFSVVSDDKDLIGSSCYNLLQVCYALLVSIIYMKWKTKPLALLTVMDLMFRTLYLVSLLLFLLWIQEIFSIKEYNFRKMKVQLVAIVCCLVALQVT